MIYFCCDKRRREAVGKHQTLNGIDFLEVDQNQRILYVHLIKPVPIKTQSTPNTPPSSLLTASNIRIKGGERIRKITITDCDVGMDGMGEPPEVLRVLVDTAGDFSTYTIRLVKDAENPQQPDDFDPLLSAIDFSFRVDCPSDFDCEQQRICPPEPRTEPEIDYMAKDYNSFRQLILDRLSVLTPLWSERHAADLGIALVELLAYVGDYLSYQQDAIATEAYLGTARLRTSVRRHARLVDYFMHNGSNARVWVQVQVNTDLVLHKEGTQLLTNDPEQPEIFEIMDEANELFQSHNTLYFYTWGARDCCLPKGATKATLQGHFPNLKEKRDVLIFEEVCGPDTGEDEDADPSHRHAVRLTSVVYMTPDGKHLQDPLGGRFQDNPNDDPVDITEIEWGAEDALPFPLCISSIKTLEDGSKDPIDNVSVARGNIVLADSGKTIPSESFDPVPSPVDVEVAVPGEDRCEEHEPVRIYPRFRPHLREQSLVHAAQYDISNPPSASAAMNWSFSDPLTLPVSAIQLSNTSDDKPWEPHFDLLGSGSTEKHFVVELEADGIAYLRFGDDQHGQRPEPGSVFTAKYRVGNGVQGNVGAETITRIHHDNPNPNPNPYITGVRNPLPARGGTEPESIEDVRQKAPSVFRTQERAVTPDDYAEIAQRDPNIQRAAATFRWTGSWHTVFLAADRLGGAPVTSDSQRDLLGRMESYRMAGYDLEIDFPLYVSLEIEMAVCVLPDYFRSDVKAALLQVFSNRILPDGRRGVFHPDNFTFGQTVYLSPLYTAAMMVAGVSSVNITIFKRQDRPDPLKLALARGKLELGRREIARLDNDPNFPEHGVFRLSMNGGK